MTGTIDEIREFFSRKWCLKYGLDESKWSKLAPSSIDGLKIKNIESGLTFSFWAGGSGTNNMAIDSTGGCHDLSWYKNDVFETINSLDFMEIDKNQASIRQREIAEKIVKRIKPTP